MQKDKGFSLIELVVSMAILVIVGAALMGFFAYCINQYTRSNQETTLQMEAQSAQNQLQDLLLQASVGVVTKSINEEGTGISDGRELVLYTRDDENQPLCIAITLDKGKNALYYQEFSDSGSEKIKKQLFVSNVTDWKVSLYDEKENRIENNVQGSDVKPVKAKIWMQMEMGSQSYTVNQTVTFRNDICGTTKKAQEMFEKDE